MIVRAAPLPLLALCLGLAGCRKEEITAYRVPKETAPAAPATAAMPPAGGAAAAPAAPTPGAPTMAGTPVATASGPGLAWSAPAAWTAKAPGSMRKGSYTVKADGVAGEGDLSITAFPGDVGGDLANLNRWRGQLSLGPVGPAEFEAAVQRLERNGLKLIVVDISGGGAGAQRILGAMVPHQGATWFFKLLGPDALVAKEKAAFLAFLDTVKPAAP